jgi:hypothetical protein
MIKIKRWKRPRNRGGHEMEILRDRKDQEMRRVTIKGNKIDSPATVSWIRSS